VHAAPPPFGGGRPLGACADSPIFTSSFTSLLGRGVVVAATRGSLPSLSPNIIVFQVSSSLAHTPISSHHAASNCGPRKLSGSSAENTYASAPFGHASLRRVTL
jgi:hypothetical protein